MHATQAVYQLVAYAQANGLLDARDTRFAQNAVMAAIGMDAPHPDAAPSPGPLPATATALLDTLCGEAVRHGVIEDLPYARDRLADHLMSLLMPPPSAVMDRFEAIRGQDGTPAATDWYYAFCRASNYIRVDSIARNVAFPHESGYGTLEITINLSKPEKDPREIAMQRSAPQSDYPRCMLCVENEGYAGRPGYPSHETLRMLPLCLGGEAWHLQYSPYAYYGEHCIALNARHVPMRIARRTFDLLLDFTDKVPHYFIGSNADLPIVGGSILAHDHFQGGRHVFPMDRAEGYAAFTHGDFPDVHIEAVRWPMTCLRLQGHSRQTLASLADRLLGAWRAWDDREADILHASDGAPHNTITPIARRAADGSYILQLVLRNNRATAQHPLGIFHPHAALHHIKKENIGLIEVMGLFVLPGRLDAELEALEGYLTGARRLVRPAQDDALAGHFDWVAQLVHRHGTGLPRPQAQNVLRAAVGEACVQVLHDCGVYKDTPAGHRQLARFLQSAGVMPMAYMQPWASACGR